MPEKFFPAIFVLLWASAFISAVYGLTGAGPFSYLFVRFAIVTVIFALLALALRAPRLSRQDILVSLTVGVLTAAIWGVFSLPFPSVHRPVSRPSSHRRIRC